MSKHDKPYPGKKTQEFPYGKDWHHVETAGLRTAGTVEVSVDPERFGASVALDWPCADLSHTAPDADHDYNGPAALRVRLSPAEAQELVSRIIVAMASVKPEAS
jgi:hypothetical protein